MLSEICEVEKDQYFMYLTYLHMCTCMLSHVQLCATPWTIAPLSVELSRQEYWRGLPFPSPGDIPDLGIEPGSPALQGNSLQSEPPGKPCMGMGNWICNPCRSQDYTKGIIYKANSELADCSTQ